MKASFFFLSVVVLLSPVLAFAQENSLTRSATEREHNRLPSTEKAPEASFKNVELGEKAYLDLLFEFNVGVGGGEYGIATDGNYIYTTKWNGSEFYRYNMDGTYIETFSVPGVSNIRDLAYDGTYFYGSPNNNTIFEICFDSEMLISSFTTTATSSVRGIAYDADNDGFWVTSGWSSPITLIDRTGGVVSVLTTSASSMSGLGWENVTTGDSYLWVYSQTGPSVNLLTKIDINTGDIIETIDVADAVQVNEIAGGLIVSDLVYPGKWALLGVSQNEITWALELADKEPDEPVSVPLGYWSGWIFLLGVIAVYARSLFRNAI